MRNVNYILLSIAILINFSSCENYNIEPTASAYIVNKTNLPVTFYTETDSLVAMPLKRTYLANIIVQDNKIISWRDSKWDFNMHQPIIKVAILKTNMDTQTQSSEIYDMPEEFVSMFMDISNYSHVVVYSEGTDLAGRHTSNSYEYYLTASFLNTIINEHLVNNSNK